MQEIILKNNQSSHFTLISYPDGQHSIKLALNKLNVKEPVSIKCRIRYFSELEVLFCLVNALRKNDFYVASINFVYLFGMRSDRAFEIGEPNYFRDVLAPVINLLKTHIYVMVPHNPDQLVYIEGVPTYPDYSFTSSLSFGGDKSVKRWASGLHGYFEKKRTKDRITVDLHYDYEEFNYDSIMVVDDLCDGGATFLEEARYLKDKYPDKKLKLFVHHGLFTQGVNVLASYYDEIICTNSYHDIEHPKVKQIKVI